MCVFISWLRLIVSSFEHTESCLCEAKRRREDDDEKLKKRSESLGLSLLGAGNRSELSVRVECAFLVALCVLCLLCALGL